MKKTIKILLKKMDDLRETKDGTLQGGFASIKGGFQPTVGLDNFLTSCTNTKNCTNTTNSGGCVNTGTCFI